MRAAGKQFGRLVLQPLDAGADGREAFGRVALRAFRRRRHGEAAVVADEPPLEAVIDQPGVAVRALQAEAAGAAQRQRRIAAAVEEQQRLLLALERDLHRLGQPRRDEAPARRAFAAHVDRLDHRHVLAAEALGQLDALVAAAPRVDLRFDRRRRRGEHHRNLRDAPAHHRHVAGVIVRAVLLLVGRVVLLIDDDEAEIGIGQKQRRARADHDRDFVRRHRRPGALARARRKLRMPFRRPHAEALGEAVERLRGERDLRHQDQRLPLLADVLRHRLEIDFGLARAGDAVEQRHRGAALIDDGAQRIRRGQLREHEIRLAEIRIGRQRHRLRRQHHRHQRALVDQPVDDAGRDARLARGVALGARQAIGEEMQHAHARRRHARRRRPAEPHADALAAGPEMLAHAQRHAQHHAARAERVIGDPVDEAAQLALERRHVELAGDVLHAVVQARIGRGVVGPDHAHAFAARAQRHRDEIAGRERRVPRRHPVGIGLVERHRHQDVDDVRGP